MNNRFAARSFESSGRQYLGIYDLQRQGWVAGWSWYPEEHENVLSRIRNIKPEGAYNPDLLVLYKRDPNTD